MNLLIVDNNIRNLNYFITCINEYTKYILLDSSTDTFESLLNKIEYLSISSYIYVGLVREEYHGITYTLINNQITPSILENVQLYDASLNTWTEIFSFFLNIYNKYNYSELDLITCNLESYPDYIYIITNLSKYLNIPIGASTSIIGNINYGGSWIETTTNTNLQTIYFTDNILQYPNIFGSKLVFAICKNKIYDGTNYANITLSGLVFGDIICYNANYNTANVGYNLPVTVSLSGTIVSTISPLSTSSTCVLWLDAQDSTTLVLNGNSLLQWNDKSGFARNATKYGTSSTYATFNSTGFNNLPAIQMNTNQGLSVPMPVNTCSVGISVFVVFQKNGAINDSETLVARCEPYKPSPIDMYNTTRLQGNNSTYAGLTSSFNFQTATGLNLYSLTDTNTLWDEYINGTSKLSIYMPNGYGDNATKFYIGTRGDYFTNFTGVIGEVLVYNSVLSTNERQIIEGYLAIKWKLTSLLPSSHPYYNYNYINITTNYTLYSSSIYGNILQRPLYIKNTTKTYDGTPYVSMTISNIINTDILDYIINYNSINVITNNVLNIVFNNTITNTTLINITNNYFTSPSVTTNTCSLYTQGSSPLPGWNCTWQANGSGRIGICNGIYGNSPILPNNISQFAVVNIWDPYNPMSIYQTILLTPGNYILTFYVAALTNNYESTDYISVSLNNNVIISSIYCSTTAWNLITSNFTIYTSGYYNLQFIFTMGGGTSIVNNFFGLTAINLYYYNYNIALPINILNNNFNDPYYVGISSGSVTKLSTISGWILNINNTNGFAIGVGTLYPFCSAPLPVGLQQYLSSQILTSYGSNSISQNFYLNSGQYKLSFYCSARTGYWNSNCYMTAAIGSFYNTYYPVVTTWTLITNNFQIYTTGNYTLTFTFVTNGGVNTNGLVDFGLNLTGVNIVYLTNNLPFPLNISNIQLWLDAQDLNTLDLTSNSLNKWKDKSGYMRDATKYGISSTNATYNSTGFNNLPAIQINTNQGLVVSIPSGTFSNGVSVFVIFQKNGSANTTEGVINRTINNIPAPFDAWGTNRWLGNGTTSATTTSSFNLQTATNLNLFCFYAALNIWNEYLNGTNIFNASYNTSFADNGTTINIGSRNDNNTLYFTGVIGEVIVYNKILSSNERQLIEGYLACKWNIQSLLPSSHPYYQLQPLLYNNTYNLYQTTISNNIVIPLKKTLMFPSLYGCVYNFDARYNVSYSNTQVSSWTDTINNISANQPYVNQQPIYVSNFINTLPSINFGLVSTSILITNTNSIQTTDLTLFFVFKLSSISTVQFCSTIGSYITGSLHILLSSAYSNKLIFALNPYGNMISNFIPSLNTPYIICINFTSTGGCIVSLRVNGLFDSSNTYTTTSSVNISSYFELGGWSEDTSRTFSGGISSFIQYNRTLSLAEIQVIEGYLAWSWNITLNSSHPFATTQPSYNILQYTTGQQLIFNYSPQINLTTNNTNILQNAFLNLLYTKNPLSICMADLYNGTYTIPLITFNNISSYVVLTNVNSGNGSGNGSSASINYLYGSTTSKMLWPANSVPALKYTICSITRYTGGNNGRILQCSDANWLHGHWGNSRGMIYYEGWICQTTLTGSNTDWVVCCAKTNGTIPNNVIFNNIQTGQNTVGGSSLAYTLSINTSIDYSDWAFSQVYIWNQELSDSEMLLVSKALMDYLQTGINPLLQRYKQLYNNPQQLNLKYPIIQNINYNTTFLLNNDSYLYYYYSFNPDTVCGTQIIDYNNKIATLSHLNMISLNNYVIGTGSLCLNVTYSQYVTLPPFTVPSTGMTICCWFLNNNSGTYGRVCDFSTSIKSGPIGYSFCLCIYSGNLTLFYNVAGNNIYQINYPINNNIWYHYTCSIDPLGTLSVYVNGILYSSININYTNFQIGTLMNYFFIGRSTWTADPYFNGYIDEFRFYTRPLTASEVYAIYTYQNNTSYNNYTLSTSNITYTILPAPLTLLPIGQNKIYDSNIYANIIYNISGIILGDNIDISSGYISLYRSPNVGSSIIDISNIKLFGSQSNNYTIASTSSISGTITAKQLTSNFYSLNKIYDSTANANVNYNLSGFCISDMNYVDISHVYIPLYRSPNVGSSIIDISNIILFGSQANNYTIDSTSSISGIIYKRYLYINGNNKLYDSTLDATVTISNIINNDIVITSYSSLYNSKNIGYNLISISSIIGLNPNYQLYNIYTYGTISSIPLYASFSGGTKIYDYTCSTLNLSSISYNFIGLYNNDNVTISSIIATFKNKNVGPQYIDVSNIILTGSDSINYFIINPPPFLSYINKFGLHTYFYSLPKIYDYSTNATNYIFGSLSGIFGSDNVSISSYIGTYRQFTVGNNIIDISNLILTNSDAYNYYVLPITSISGLILQKNIDLIISNGTKIYDGSTIEYNLNISLSGILGLDIVGISGYTTVYKSKQAGYQLIDISNLILNGVNSYNYYVPDIQSYLGYIKPKNIIISYINTQQQYNGLIYNNYNIDCNGLVNGDNITSLSGILNYAISTNNLYNTKNNIISNHVNWVIVGISGIFYSMDGSNWYNSNNIFNTYGCSIATNNNLWVAVGSSSNTLAYSYDGITWIGLGNNIFTSIGLYIIYNNNIWYATGQGTHTIAYSLDGIIWTPTGTNIFTNYACGISINNNMIIAVGQGNNTIAYTYDNNIWYGLGNILFNNGNSIVNNNIIWVALGKGSVNTLAYSYDGIHWIGLGITIFNISANYAIWDGVKFIAIGEGINTIAYSFDGINWIGLGNIIFSSGLSISFNGTIYIATGNTGNGISYDGINWTTLLIKNMVIYGIESKKSIQYLYSNQIIDVGIYNILPGGLYSSNYYISYNAGITKIMNAILQIRQNNYNKIYDGLIFNNFGVSYTGFMHNDTSNNLIGNLTYYNTNILNVGTYYVTPSGLIAYNYNIRYNYGIINILPAPLIIKVNNNIKIYDKLTYLPTYSIYGLQNDTLNSLSGNIIYSGTYNNVNVGYYDIIISGLSSINYNIKYINGFLQINKATLYITANNDTKILYNDISNFVLMYDPLYYNITGNNIISLQDTLQNKVMQSINGYYNACSVSFNPPDYLCGIGLYYNNNNYIVSTDKDDIGYYISINELSNIYKINSYIIPNDLTTTIKIIYQYSKIIYYLNNNIIRTTDLNTNNKLYMKLFTYYANQQINNINFTSLYTPYYGGNGYYCNGFKGDDTIQSLSGIIQYSGNSQGAIDEGNYSIIINGLSSINYNIIYINGTLTIKRSIQK